MRVIRKNAIASLRALTASLPFFIFIIIGAILEAEPHVMIIGGLAVWAFFYVLGHVVANILTQLETEIDVKPVEKKESLTTKLGLNIDISQGAELPE